MILALQILLLIASAFVALLAFVCVRQAGLLVDRLPKWDAKGGKKTLGAGDELPIRRVPDAWGRTVLPIPLPGPRPTFLLFASFSCNLCRPILRGLAGLPQGWKERIVLMVLDRMSSADLEQEISRYGLEGLSLAAGHEAVDAFNVFATPYVFAVGNSGKILHGMRLLESDDLNSVLGRFGPPPDAQQPRPDELPPTIQETPHELVTK